jgi:hypothetical protein
MNRRKHKKAAKRWLHCFFAFHSMQDHSTGDQLFLLPAAYSAASISLAIFATSISRCK